MSKELTVADAKIPAHILARMDAGTSALATNIAGGLTGGSWPRISLKGSRFRIIEDGTETLLEVTRVPVVIVGANPGISKNWYAKAWDADAEPERPDCYSTNGHYPHPDSENIQNDTCAGCPQNAWGSKITPAGKEVKACADLKRLAVVAADDPSGPVYLLQVTPAALKDLNQYQKSLSNRGLSPETIITMLSFDTDASFPKLQFAFGGFLDEDGLAAVDDKVGSIEALEVTGEAELNREPVEREAGTKAPAKPSVKAKPVTDDYAEAKAAFADAEATKAEADKAAKDKARAELAAQMAALDDEGAAGVEEAPAAKRGFRKAAVQPEAEGAEEAPTAKAKPAAKAKAKPATKEVAGEDELADEITKLLAEANDD